MNKINFVNNQAPALSAQNLNQMQTNAENAINTVDTRVTQMGLDKQDKLIGTQTAGQNIKTINGQNILGAGDLSVDTGKIDKIKVQGVEQTITNKEVDLDVPTMEQIYDLMPNGTATGENIHITDSSNLKCEVKGEGNLKQQTTTGKNLINVADYSGTLEDYFVNKATGYTLEEGVEYTFSLECETSVPSPILSLGVGTTYYQYEMSNGSGGTIGNRKYVRFTPTATDIARGGKLFFRFPRYNTPQSGTTYTVRNIMLVKGTDTVFEPYTGGVTPRPDYKQDIEVITGSVTEKITGKNLSKPIATSTKNGMVLTYNDDGSYMLNGTTTANTSFWISGLNYNVGNYSLSLNNPITNALPGFYYQAETSAGNFARTFTELNAKKENFIVTKPIITLSVVIPNGTTLNNFIFKPQLEKGSVSTSFEKYQENTSIINLQGNEVVKLSATVKDELDVDIEGNVKLTKKIGKVVLDGTENWATTSYSRFYCDNLFIGIKSENGAISDYFVRGNTETTNNVFGISPLGRIYLRNDEQTTLANFKTWLSQHPVTVYYELATPQVIDLEQVTPLHTYKNVSNISADTNIPMNMEVKYKKDLETIINELATAIVSQ